MRADLKVLFFSLGPETMASSRSRVYQYAPYLKTQGVEVRIINYISSSYFKLDVNSKRISIFLRLKNYLFSKVQTLKILFLAKGYDVVIVQRILLSKCEQALLKAVNPRIVFDFDDALFAHPRLTKRFEHMVKISRHLIFESAINLDYTRKFNINVSRIIGPIDIHRYRAKVWKKIDEAPVVIGWIGSVSTNKYLNLLHDVLKKIQDKYKDRVVIKVVSSGRLAWNDIFYTFVNWALESEIHELQDFDIGIMPLEDDDWCKGKGGYKLLQYMALGIPSIASPVGTNRELILDGVNGFFAATDKEWIDRISELIEDRELRSRMGMNGRKMAEEKHSYEKSMLALMPVLEKVGGRH